MLSALAAYQRGLAGRKAQICYAMKANSSLAVLQLFARAGCGFDIVSGGELERVLAAGGDPAKVIFSGVGKTRAEMAQALRAGIGCFNVESESELDVLHRVASELGCIAPVSLRVNPNVDAKTHPYISTGLKDNKFGIAHENALAAYRHAASLSGLRVVGIDVLRVGPLNAGLVPEVARTAGASDGDRRSTGELFDADTVFLSPAALEWLGVRAGDLLQVRVGAVLKPLRIAGTLPGAPRGQRVAVMDIGAAQWQFDRLGVLQAQLLGCQSGLD
jgi:hypothetical protein